MILEALTLQDNALTKLQHHTAQPKWPSTESCCDSGYFITSGAGQGIYNDGIYNDSTLRPEKFKLLVIVIASTNEVYIFVSVRW